MMISNGTVSTITPVQYSGTGLRSILFVIGAPHIYSALNRKQRTKTRVRDLGIRLSETFSFSAIIRAALKLLFRDSRFLF